MLFLAVVQLTFALHVRATLVDCAAEGARYGALRDRTPADGAERARELIEMSLASSYADDVSASVVDVDGMAVVRVEVSAPLPVIGLIGPSGRLTVDGNALQESGT